MGAEPIAVLPEHLVILLGPRRRTIAQQEVNGPRAAGLVFLPDQYDLYFSARYIHDLVTGKATHADPEQRSDRIYTGFAVRRDVFDAVSSAISGASV